MDEIEFRGYPIDRLKVTGNDVGLFVEVEVEHYVSPGPGEVVYGDTSLSIDDELRLRHWLNERHERREVTRRGEEKIEG